MIEIRHLHTVQTLQQTGSVSRAADQLYLTQSALSHQIKELEQRLNQPLFIRKTKPLRFTQAGKILLELAQTILPTIAAAEMRLKPEQLIPPSELALSLECHSCYLWLLPVLNAFAKQWPDIHPELVSEHPFDPLDALAEQQLQWVLTADPQDHPAIQYTPLFHYETVLVCRDGHLLCQQLQVLPSQLADATILTYPVPLQRLDLFTEFLQPAGITPLAIRYTRHPLMMLQQVSQSDQLAALPRWVVSEFGQALELKTLHLGQGIWRTMYLAHLGALSPWAHDFVSLTHKIINKYQGIKKIGSNLNGE
ncbi:LysR substrate-binding domain-containing protein [Celerinatantimonas yamalensis]|uniref:LysR substrate-binding domain-containing protein n=1 Tax=Celerinatantimonas yamalensis TaxID=559956 RepID=A0ABW9G9M7_9GAMM